ncbi:MAG: hypothetical protein LWX83_09865 [Anaerolineae bacterium]|nr:hypothetical protein [Anaerolineae bacterium]
MCIPNEADIVLVAVMPSRRDFEIARILGWYRIPLRFAPKFVDVDCLAFYQTTAFGAERQGKIEYIARVKGYELTTRRELFKDEPDHPRVNEEYYKIQIGPVQQLEKPLKAGRWKRLTFLFTLGDVFNTAQTIDDLVLKSDQRQILWKTVREKKGKNQYHVPDDDLVNFNIEQDLLEFLGGWSKIVETSAYYPD